MITFLRKTRKSLVNSGNTKRYLQYGLGEILLVVIGILIALQINSWNQNRKDRIQEQHYLQNLYEEFQVNLETLEALVEFHEAQISNADLVLKVLTRDTIVDDIEKLHTSLLHVGWSPSRNISKDVWTELISTGNMGLIVNNNLKELISNFHSSFDYFKEVDQEWSSFNLRYRERIRGVLPPQLHLEVGSALGFYKVNRSINGDLLSQQEISKNLNSIDNLGGLIGDIIICRKVGLLVTERIHISIRDILTLIEKELNKKS